MLGGVAGAALVPAMSAMVPFEAWIAAGDRQNGGNVLVAVLPTGEPVAAWIDYAFSLDHAWERNLHTTCTLPPCYPPLGEPDPAIMKEIACRIEAMKDEEIEGVVNRIPGNCLEKAVRDSICANLLERRAAVRGLC